MIYPFKKLEKEQLPYTFHTVEMNIKERVVFCPNCKYSTNSMLPAPRCGMCNGKLITYVESHFDELVAGDNPST